MDKLFDERAGKGVGRAALDPKPSCPSGLHHRDSLLITALAAEPAGEKLNRTFHLQSGLRGDHGAERRLLAGGEGGLLSVSSAREIF